MNLRAAAEDDLAAVLVLIRADEEALTGRPSRLGDADLRQWLLDVDLERDTWLHEEAGRPVAFAWAELHGELGFFVGVVHPEAKGRGLGARLVEAAEARVRERDAKRVHAATLEDDRAAPGLLASRGYREVRRFYEMAIELEREPEVPEPPDGLVLEPAGDLRALHAAMDEAFRDHWEHHSRPYEEWLERRTASPGYDPSLWFWIRAGDEIAAGVENWPDRNGGGYVGALATRRPWRGRGLARTLLLHSFAEFHRRGERRVTLGVDAASPTGATQLYESAGMVLEIAQVVFEKELG